MELTRCSWTQAELLEVIPSGVTLVPAQAARTDYEPPRDHRLEAGSTTCLAACLPPIVVLHSSSPLQLAGTTSTALAQRFPSHIADPRSGAVWQCCAPARRREGSDYDSALVN